MAMSISGAGGADPLRTARSLSGPRARSQEVSVEAVPPSTHSRTPTSLIHPGTASEFRRPLEGVLRLLPQPLVQAFIHQGYQLHVIDTQGLHPLTLEVADFPVEQLRARALDFAHQFSQRNLEENPWVHPGKLWDGAASTQEELEEWLYLVELLNSSGNFGADDSVLLPSYVYWNGRRLPPKLVDFLKSPGGLVHQVGEVAAMVLHGNLPGTESEGLRILVWDAPLRRSDPLLDWYLLHELGHTTDYSMAFGLPEVWRDWVARAEAAFLACQQGKHWLTRYSTESVHEYLAEGFAALFCPPRSGPAPGQAPELARQRWQCNAESLYEKDPRLGELLEEAVEVVMTLGLH